MKTHLLDCRTLTLSAERSILAMANWQFYESHPDSDHHPLAGLVSRCDEVDRVGVLLIQLFDYDVDFDASTGFHTAANCCPALPSLR